jgi:hypothetical protein
MGVLKMFNIYYLLKYCLNICDRNCFLLNKIYLFYPMAYKRAPGSLAARYSHVAGFWPVGFEWVWYTPIPGTDHETFSSAILCLYFLPVWVELKKK